MSPHKPNNVANLVAAFFMLATLATDIAAAGDLAQVEQSGRLRHLGIRYANFVTGGGDGLDVDVVRLFAERLGVDYVFVESDWSRIIPDLVGREVVRDGDLVSLGAPAAVRGDLIATGMTVLPWRAELVDFSAPMFPTQIWLITVASASLEPIAPSGDTAVDISATRTRLDGITVLAKPNTCLDPRLYDMAVDGAEVVPFEDKLKFMAPAVLTGMAEATILDVPDALVALRRFPGRIKVLGPISPPQHMAAAFAPDAPHLRAAFDTFLAEIRRDGTYDALVENYYPSVRGHYPDFFSTEEVVTP